MANHGLPSRGSADATKREQMMSMIAAALAALMFIWGFLKWLKLGDGDQAEKYAGYAFGMPTTAVIGFSVAAGLAALLGALDRRSGRGVPSAIPLALATTSLLIAVGILLGKGSISPGVGDEVGVQIGLILGLITALLQTAVLAAIMASRTSDEANTGVPFEGRATGYGSTTPQPGGTVYPPNP